jgi:ABC-type multidrug transport system ATPase subunit
MNHNLITAIELRALTKIYYNPDGSAFKVIDNFNLIIPRGRLFFLLGADGAGKTTLVEIMSGLVEPTGGMISLNGHILIPGDRSITDQVGWVLEGVQTINRRLSVWNNFARWPQVSAWPKEKLKQRLESLMNEFDLWEFHDCPVFKLSPSQQRLVTFIRALLADPPVIIFDEPLAGLDAATAQKVKHWLTKLVNARGKTVIIATHRPELPEELGGEVALISHGRLVTQRSVAQLLRLPEAIVYQITFKGHLDRHWSEWFDNLALTYTEKDETLLSGPIKDQAALYGVLIKIRDLALPLLSVTRTGPNLANVMQFFQLEDSLLELS